MIRASWSSAVPVEIQESWAGLRSDSLPESQGPNVHDNLTQTEEEAGGASSLRSKARDSD